MVLNQIMKIFNKCFSNQFRILQIKRQNNKTFFASKLEQMSQIKITSFKRLDDSHQNKQPKLIFTHANKPKINVLYYTDQQNHKAKQLENWMRKQLKQKISFIKIVQEKSISHTFQTVINQKNQKIFFISTKLLTQKIKDLFRQNINESFQRIYLILFLDELQKVPPQIYHLRNLSLITNQPQKIKQILTSQISNLKSQNQQNQLSSINSQNQQNFQNQFQKVDPVFFLHSGNKNHDQRGHQIVFNDNPGVGSYDISINFQSFKGSSSGTFSKQKR